VVFDGVDTFQRPGMADLFAQLPNPNAIHGMVRGAVLQRIVSRQFPLKFSGCD
jgi:hypothetical protein